MNSDQSTQTPLMTHHALFAAHMLLLRWGRERLARQKMTVEGGNGLEALTPSTESAPTEKVGTPVLSPEKGEVANQA